MKFGGKFFTNTVIVTLVTQSLPSNSSAVLLRKFTDEWKSHVRTGIPMVTKLQLTKERENTCLPFTEEIPTICDTTSIVSLYWFVGGIRLRNKKKYIVR